VFKRREKLDPHPNLTCKNAFLMVGYVEAEAEVETEAGGSGVEGMGGFTSTSSNTPGCIVTIGSGMIQQFVQEYLIESMARFSDLWNKKKNKCAAYFYLQLTTSVKKKG